MGHCVLAFCEAQRSGYLQVGQGRQRFMLYDCIYEWSRTAMELEPSSLVRPDVNKFTHLYLPSAEASETRKHAEEGTIGAPGNNRAHLLGRNFASGFRPNLRSGETEANPTSDDNEDVLT